jgi:hypothetical protein
MFSSMLMSWRYLIIRSAGNSRAMSKDRLKETQRWMQAAFS